MRVVLSAVEKETDSSLSCMRVKCPWSRNPMLPPGSSDKHSLRPYQHGACQLAQHAIAQPELSPLYRPAYRANRKADTDPSLLSSINNAAYEGGSHILRPEVERYIQRKYCTLLCMSTGLFGGGIAFHRTKSHF